MPLRLEVAAQLAFPDGSITASALRRMAATGKLDYEKIAGKIYVTLNSILKSRSFLVMKPSERPAYFACPVDRR